MLSLLLLLAVIVAVREHVVVVVVGVPVRPVLPLVQRIARVVMRDMEVVVTLRSLTTSPTGSCTTTTSSR